MLYSAVDPDETRSRVEKTIAEFEQRPTRKSVGGVARGAVSGAAATAVES
jgi:hypothetical protein